MKFAKLALLVAGVVTAVGAANAAKDPSEIKLGYSIPQLANPWFVGVKLGMEKACEELGIQCISIDAQYRVDKQVSDIENMISDKYDAILSTPIDSNALVATYEDAKKAGIATGSIAQLVPNSNLLYGMDEYNYGHTIGSQAANWAKATLQCKGKVALITQDNVEATKHRGDGIEAAVKEICPGMEIVARQAGDNPESGMKIIEAVLQQHPDLNLVIGSNDSGGIGGYQAMVANNAVGPDRAVFSGDATRECLALMQEPDSIYRGTVDLYPYKGGYESAKYLYEMVQNGLPAEPVKTQLPYVEVPQADVLSGKYKASY
ncbi:MAG TPA: sugar ABC transporter substrate-binding protein [Candidatus Avisuccinivibrio pullicola]|nr:sugar ABC transporter substrate-binding protein [Candidatus Avisuccinivibrio pullicola]